MYPLDLHNCCLGCIILSPLYTYFLGLSVTKITSVVTSTACYPPASTGVALELER